MADRKADRKIVRVEFGKGDDLREVVTADFDDGTRSEVFRFYRDEVSFAVSELIGLTEEEAWDLFRKKDAAYLQAP